jgi:glutathionylspermidine synthase
MVRGATVEFDMHCQRMDRRIGWKTEFDRLGYLASLLDDPPYWVEAIEDPFCAVFDYADVEIIKAASLDLWQLALSTVDHVVNSSDSEQLFDKLCIPKFVHSAIRQSWRRADRSLYGRFDFAYNDGHLKLLELNFDTPTSLYEAAVLQRVWLEDILDEKYMSGAQFNTLHESLINCFARIVSYDSLLHFSSIKGTPEDEETVRYLQSCAIQAGHRTAFTHMEELAIDDSGQLYDSADRPIEQLFKLYPWEFINEEENLLRKILQRNVFAGLIESGRTSFFEPAWKCILSNKGILPIMWELAPGHPFLLESCFDDQSSLALQLRNQAHVRKPIFGREGGSVSIVFPSDSDTTSSKTWHNESSYGREGFVLQKYHPLCQFRDYHVVIGSWIVDDQPAGIGLRADQNPITSNQAIFVPHRIQELAAA